MKCVNCDHEQGFHVFDGGLSPCALTNCCCIEFLEETLIDRTMAFKEAVKIVEEYAAKYRNCLCGHSFDIHANQIVLPNPNFQKNPKKVKTRCLIPTCGCGEFQ